MIVKICGITTLEDAQAAVAAGADMLGFNFYEKSSRYIHPQECRKIIKHLPMGSVYAIGVFVNLPPQKIQAIMQTCGLNLAQLSGDESPADLAALHGYAFKALRPANAEALQADLLRYAPHKGAPAWLLDAYHPGAYGGTGESADWELAADLAAKAPIILAGGLRPENVFTAVTYVHPWGVDVASGVESSPGIKDHTAMKAFIKNAKCSRYDSYYLKEEPC
jgi:phosphoribosylanthranilate isomerase